MYSRTRSECGYVWRHVAANGGNTTPETNDSPKKVTDSARDIVKPAA
jgi:hypothetical protein